MLVMEKVAPWRSPMTVYGLPNSALADDKAPAMSLPSLSVCLHTSLPFLSLFFLLSLSLPPLFRSPHTFLTPSCLLTFPRLCFFFRRRLVSRSNGGVVHFTAVPTASPKSQSIYSLRPPLRIGEFSFPRPSTILPPVCLPPHTHPE